jgi:hypothetical protein
MSSQKQHAPKPKVELKDRTLQDLARSGITPETALREKVFSGTSRTIHEILGWPAGPGTVFQYGRGFWRVKLYRKQKDNKQYRQRKATGNRIYVPWTLPDRDRVLADPTIPLIITEGEKKSIKGAQEGLTIVALSGVYGFLSNGKPIPDLDAIAWDDRPVEIVFDSDPDKKSKGQVDKARQELAAVLTIRGATIKAVILPDNGKEKVGLDDYLVTHTVDDFLALPRQDVPLASPVTNRSGEVRRSYVTPQIEKLIWEQLLKKVKPDFCEFLVIPDFDTPMRTVLDSGMRADHLTARLPGKGGRDPRVKVGKASFAYVVVYYNLHRRALHPKGKHRMVPPRVKDMPVWQALMELEAGDTTLPGEYRCQLPACAPQAAIDVAGAWLKTRWARHRKYPGCSTVFDPEMLSLMLTKPRSYVLSGW